MLTLTRRTSCRQTAALARHAEGHAPVVSLVWPVQTRACRWRAGVQSDWPPGGVVAAALRLCDPEVAPPPLRPLRGPTTGRDL